jgi:hypothetical protein
LARANIFEALIEELMDNFEAGGDAPATLNSGADFRTYRVSLQTTNCPQRCRQLWLAEALLSALSSPAILFADHAAPRRQTLGGMLLHPLSELRRAHQAGLH